MTLEPHIVPCAVCGNPVGPSATRYCSLSCYYRALLDGLHEDPPPPSLEEIAELTAEIRASWSEREHAKRLRPDWHPWAWKVPCGTLLSCASEVADENG